MRTNIVGVLKRHPKNTKGVKLDIKKNNFANKGHEG
jgi:hypothetical protein